MLGDFKLKVFLTVCEKESFTKAARNLGITQPAVSQNVAELEKELGAPLFVREKGSVSLTAAGVAFKEYASRIQYWCSAAEGLFASAGGFSSRRPVRIAADGYSAEILVPQAAAALSALNPGLTFTVTGEGEYDARLWSAPHSSEQTLEEGASLVGGFQAAVVSGEDGPDRIPEKAPLAVWSPYVTLLDAGLRPRVAFQASSPSAVAAFVSRSPGSYGILPRESACSSGLPILGVTLPGLAFDTRFEAASGFSGSPLAKALRTVLEDFVKD